MPRRAMRTRRRSKRRTQWVIATAGYGGSSNLINAGAFTGVQFQSLLDTSSVASAGGDPVLDRFMVERVVGDVLFSWSVVPTGDVAFQLHWGIIAGQVNAGAGTVVFDPSSSTDADAMWLTLRHAQVGQFANQSTVGSASMQFPQTFISSPVGNSFMHVDIKVKRIIRPNFRMYIVAKGTSAVPALPATGTLAIVPFLRSLVSRAI